MKKILVVFTASMELGGIEKSLLGLLDSINYDQYEVDLFLYGVSGPLLPYVNPRVNILPEVKELAYLRKSFKDKLRHGCFYSAFRRVIDGFKKLDNDTSWNKVLHKVMKPIAKEYDLAVGFFAPFDLLRDYVTAKVKVGWIHTDYSRDACGTLPYLQQTYRGLDYIVAVSESCRKTFCELMPEYADKTVVMENILPYTLIQQQAKMPIAGEMDKGSIKLLSVGRFCTAKNFDNVPAMVRMMRENGMDVVWYLIGFGGDEALIRQKINEYQVDDHVVILGKKENPYPYIKACDIYVQPSRYEGKCVAVREAQMFGKPVVITNYPTAPSQLDDGVDGVIVPMDNEGCAKGIMRVMEDKHLQAKLSANCQKRDYSNVKEIDVLYKWIEQ